MRPYLSSLLLSSWLSLLGCDGCREDTPEAAHEPNPAEGDGAAPTVEVRSAHTEPAGEPIAREDAVARALTFVREQGYLDTPLALTPDAIQREMMDPAEPDQIAEFRLNTLQAEPACARGGPERWSVVFRYTAPEHAELGRVLRVGPDEEIALVHQDVKTRLFCPPIPPGATDAAPPVGDDAP